MKRINVNELSNHIGETVLIKGWVSQFRKLSKISFIVLRERTGYCQIIVPKSILEESISVESVVEIVGFVKEEKQSQYGGIEIVAESIKITSVAQTLPFPINREEGVPFNTLNNFRPLTLRKE